MISIVLRGGGRLSFLSGQGFTGCSDPESVQQSARYPEPSPARHPELVSGSKNAEVVEIAENRFRIKFGMTNDSCHPELVSGSNLLPIMSVDKSTLPQGERKVKLKFGFTLAEVLITLGIIGVVAAMTLPALLNATQGKELEAGFKKSYSVLSQAVQRLQYEEGLSGDWEKEFGANTFLPVFRKYLLNYVKCSGRTCVNSDLPPDEDGFQRVSTYKTYNKSKNVTLEWFDEGQMVMADGMLLMVNNSSAALNNLVLTVDVNGMYKKPNAWGHDLFSFQIKSGKLIPMGHPKTTSDWGSLPCDVNSTARHNGIGCAYKVFQQKDYFKNLPR